MWYTDIVCDTFHFQQMEFFLLQSFIYLFGVLHHFQHCTGHIMTDSWKGRGNQYLGFIRVLYCKLPTNGKQLPAFPLEAMQGIEPRPQRRKCYHSATMAPLLQSQKLNQLNLKTDYLPPGHIFQISVFTI